MKHIKRLNEINARFNQEEDRFMFDPAEEKSTVSFYLHKDKQGFAMDIDFKDKDKLEKILKDNNINYTVTVGNILPF